MGLASYSEDIFLRFLEDKESKTAPEVGVAALPAHHCPFCRDTFEDYDVLLEHLAEAHHGDRPILLLGGNEPDRRETIRERLYEARVVVRNCTAIRIRIDGSWARLAPEDLSDLLRKQTDSVVEIELINRYDKRAEPVSQRYHLTIKVPPKRALDEVDRAFTRYLAVSAPTMEHVTRFLEDHRAGGVALEYADALATYVRGVLIRDQSIGSGVTLPPAEAPDLYSGALEVLRTYERPLPSVICRLIRFALNDFGHNIQPVRVRRLDAAVAVLAPLAGQAAFPRGHDGQEAGGRTMALCPIDQSVERVLGLTERLEHQTRWGPTLDEECRQAADAKTLEVTDRQKVLALWAEAALRAGSDESATEPLRRLRSTFPFGTWASSHLDRLERGSH
jgi:hypothetical protein